MSFTPLDRLFNLFGNKTVNQYEQGIAEKNKAANERYKELHNPRAAYDPRKLAVTPRPEDASLSDGKRQRSFAPPVQLYGQRAAFQSATAIAMERRPMESRDFEDEIMH